MIELPTVKSLLIPTPPATVNAPVVLLVLAVVPVILTLAPDIFPVTAKLLNVPTLVIFGCAFVYTVPATSALPT